MAVDKTEHIAPDNFRRSINSSTEFHSASNQWIIDVKCPFYEEFLKLFESDEKNIVINYLKFPNGFEKAIEAALGHGLKASLEKSSIEWRNIDQQSLKSLPEGIKSLSDYTKGVPEVLNILKYIG